MPWAQTARPPSPVPPLAPAAPRISPSASRISTAGLRREPAGAVAGECHEEIGIVLGALSKRAARRAHRHRRPRLPGRYVDAEYAGAVLALRRLEWPEASEHDDPERLDLHIARLASACSMIALAFCGVSFRHRGSPVDGSRGPEHSEPVTPAHHLRQADVLERARASHPPPSAHHQRHARHERRRPSMFTAVRSLLTRSCCVAMDVQIADDPRLVLVGRGDRPTPVAPLAAASCSRASSRSQDAQRLPPRGVLEAREHRSAGRLRPGRRRRQSPDRTPRAACRRRRGTGRTRRRATGRAGSAWSASRCELRAAVEPPRRRACGPGG